MADLSSLARALSDQGGTGGRPVDDWHPTRCGEMDLVIRADGTWVHEGAPIEKPALVRLFASVLRRDGDGYVLVTPAEKLSITVEDAPFVAVDFDSGPDGLAFRTNLGDVVVADRDHPIVMRRSEMAGAVVPYLRVRGGLEARLSRGAYYRLIEAAEQGHDGALSVISGGERFVLGPAA